MGVVKYEVLFFFQNAYITWCNNSNDNPSNFLDEQENCLVNILDKAIEDLLYGDERYEIKYTICKTGFIGDRSEYKKSPVVILSLWVFKNESNGFLDEIIEDLVKSVMPYEEFWCCMMIDKKPTYIFNHE